MITSISKGKNVDYKLRLNVDYSTIEHAEIVAYHAVIIGMQTRIVYSYSFFISTTLSRLMPA